MDLIRVWLLSTKRVLSYIIHVHFPSHSSRVAIPSFAQNLIFIASIRFIALDRCGNRDTRRRSSGSKSWKENSCLSSGVRRIWAVVMVRNMPIRVQHLSLNKSDRRHRCLNHLRPIQEVDHRAKAAGGGEVQVPTLAAIEVMWNPRRRRCLLSSGCLSDHLQMMMTTTT